MANELSGTRNGLNLDALGQVIEQIQQDPSKAVVEFKVSTEWKGQTRSESRVDACVLGGQSLERNFRITADEPAELLGSNSAPNPQELLMSALNSCMLVGYVAGAAVNGIRLERVEISSEGSLDLRGFLGLDQSVPAGYESIRYTVRIKGDGTHEQFEAIHQNVMKTSPNYFNLARPVRLEGKLEVQA